MSDEFEIQGAVEGTPDLSDLAIVIINAETKDGRQLSFCVYPVGEEKMSMATQEYEEGRQELTAGAQAKPVRIIPATKVHTFTVTIEEKL